MQLASRWISALFFLIATSAGPLPALALDHQPGTGPNQDIRSTPKPLAMPTKSVVGQE